MEKKPKQHDGAKASGSNSKLKYYCMLCQCDLVLEDNYKSHLLGKKHKKNEFIASERQSAQCKIYVGGLRRGDNQNTEQLLWSYFSMFGKIESVKMKASAYAFVKFETAQPVKEVLKQSTHRYYSHRWIVKEFKYQTVEDEQAEKKEKKLGHHQELMKQLSNTPSISAQFKALSSHVRLTPMDLHARDSICRELEKVLGDYFSGCGIYQFGSSINGYGMQGSDLDLFLELGTRSTPFIRMSMPPFPSPLSNGSIKKLTKDRQPFSKEQVDVLEDLDKVRLMQQLLRQNGHCFKEVLLIPSKRCPLVRFIHKVTGLKCDLSLNNRKALYNSQLLKLYSQEQRVQELVFAVRTWAKFQGLASGDDAGSLLTSYAVTWFVLYFLMMREPRVIPPVCELATLLKGQGVTKEMVESCLCLQIPASAKLPPSQNTETTVELLSGFFEYYCNEVRWGKEAIRTWECERVPREIIQQDSTYEDCKLGLMTMLDPFAISHNILANVSERLKLKLDFEFKNAAALCRKWSGQRQSTSNSTDGQKPWGLMELLVPSNVEKGKEFKAALKNQEVEKHKLDGINTVRLNPSSKLLASEAFVKLSKELKMTPNGLWSSLVVKTIVNILETVFLVDMKEEVNKVDNDSGSSSSSLHMEESDNKGVEMKEIETVWVKTDCKGVRSALSEAVELSGQTTDGLTEDKMCDGMMTDGVGVQCVAKCVEEMAVGEGEEEMAVGECEDGSNKQCEMVENCKCDSGGKGNNSRQQQLEKIDDGIVCKSSSSSPKDCDLSKRCAQIVDHHDSKRFKYNQQEALGSNTERGMSDSDSDMSHSLSCTLTSQSSSSSSSSSVLPQQIASQANQCVNHKQVEQQADRSKTQKDNLDQTCSTKQSVGDLKLKQSDTSIDNTTREAGSSTDKSKISKNSTSPVQAVSSIDKSKTSKDSPVQAGSGTDKSKTSKDSTVQAGSKSTKSKLKADEKSESYTIEEATQMITAGVLRVSKVTDYSCEVTQPIWSYRGQIKKGLADTGKYTRLGLEREVTSRVLDKIKTTVNSNPQLVSGTASSTHSETGATLAANPSCDGKAGQRLEDTPPNKDKMNDSVSDQTKKGQPSGGPAPATPRDFTSVWFECRVVEAVSTMTSLPSVCLIMRPECLKDVRMFKNFFPAVNSAILDIVNAHLLEEEPALG